MSGNKDKKPRGYWNNLELCIETALKYKNISQLKESEYGCYRSIKTHKWDEIIYGKEPNHLVQKAQNFWNNKENCFKESAKYNTIYELQRHCYGCYCGLKRNGWLQEAFPVSFKNKSCGYWNKENVINEARKYKTKREFKENCKTAYNRAYALGCMKECEEFFERNKNYRNFDDKIHSIYVYEIKELNTCYIGRTVNVHNRDLSHRRGRKHSDGSITYDNLYKFCEKNNIDMPQPIVLETDLNANESLEREDYWLKVYIKDGWLALNVAKTGISSGSLGGVQIWNYDKCKEVCNRFHYKSDVKKFNYQCYHLCSKNKWFEEFGITENKRHSRFYWLSKRNCFNEVKYYQTKEDFIEYAISAYESIVEHGWENELDNYYECGEINIEDISVDQEYENEKEIVYDYTINKMSIYNICEKYHIGKIKVYEILLKYGIARRNKGKQPVQTVYTIKDWKIEKYPKIDNSKYIVFDPLTDFSTKDITNKHGTLTSYIRKQYNIEIPTLFERRKYYMITGNYWWEQWLKVKIVDSNEKKNK